MFKVNNKGTIKLNLNRFQAFFGVSIVYFEQVNPGWVISFWEITSSVTKIVWSYDKLLVFTTQD